MCILILRNKTAGHWWFMPVILVTQEAAIRRIVFKASLGK
jgi:hypothetical protein